MMLFSAARDSAAVAASAAHTDLVAAVGLETVTLEAVATVVAVETASLEMAEASIEVLEEDRTLLLKCFPQGVKQQIISICC